MNASKEVALAVWKRRCHGPPVMVLAAIILGCLLMVSPVLATSYTLVDKNSTAVIDDGSSMGMDTWTIDGTDHMFQQWFWYRVGSSGDEASVDTLGPPTFALLSDVDPDPGKEHLVLRYTGTGFTLDLTFDLVGGSSGSGVSDITEAIAINNTGSSTLDFHFYQYVDFDLGGASGGDTVEVVSGSKVEQSGGSGWVSETVITPDPSHHEAALFSTTRDKFSDGLATDLSDASGPVGPGNVTWAFQWDFSIPAGGSAIISKDKRLVVPEPATLGLLLLGGLALLRRRC